MQRCKISHFQNFSIFVHFIFAPTESRIDFFLPFPDFASRISAYIVIKNINKNEKFSKTKQKRSLEEIEIKWYERAHAFRLLRQIIRSSPSRTAALNVSSLIAVGKQQGDPFCRTALDLLADLVLMNPSAIAPLGGLSLLLDSVTKSVCKEQLIKTAFALLTLVETESGRRLINPFELQKLLVFDEKDYKNPFLDVDCVKKVFCVLFGIFFIFVDFSLFLKSLL